MHDALFLQAKASMFNQTHLGQRVVSSKVTHTCDSFAT